MEDEHEDELDEAQEDGNKALWKLFYRYKDEELLKKYPNTSVDTAYRTAETLDAYMYQERVGIPPLPGGRDNQPEEWDEQLACAYAAKAQAEEEIETKRKLKEIEKKQGLDDDDKEPDYDEED